MSDVALVNGNAQWSEDALGRGFEATELTLLPDAEGEVCATLVRHRPVVGNWLTRLRPSRRWLTRLRPSRRPSFDVLYVHGSSDYFFQSELAEFWTERGATFYALDLRKYRRSLRPNQTPGYVDDLATYDEDIAAALAVMRAQRHRPLVLMGHSTGGSPSACGLPGIPMRPWVSCSIPRGSSSRWAWPRAHSLSRWLSWESACFR